jgi:hypothetical protein
MRPLFALIYPAALLLSGGPVIGQEFAPDPRQSFQGFVGINPPRADVPVGALWIDEYGPTGEQASADNLETVRSLSSVSIDKNLQLAITFGLLNVLGIDPKARDHYTARFSDLSIVRVKDMARLSGPKGEPRIVEALKAGNVTVSSDTDIGLSGDKAGFQSRIIGSANNDRTRTYAIEARDMFIAIHVATAELIRSSDRELHLSDDARSARLDDFLLVFSPRACTSAPACPPRAGIVKINTQTSPTAEGVQLEAETKLKLPIPVSDGQGGLYDTLAVRWVPPCAQKQAPDCGKHTRLFAHYEGTRLQDLKSPRGKGW